MPSALFDGQQRMPTTRSSHDRRNRWVEKIDAYTRLSTKALTTLRGRDAALDLRERESRVLAGDHQVAVEQNLDASAVRAAIHGSDERLAGRRAPRERAKTVDACRRPLLLVTRPLLLLDAPPVSFVGIAIRSRIE